MCFSARCWPRTLGKGSEGMTDESRVSEDRAQLIWRRAAELQAEAARKLEERSRLLAPGAAGEGGEFAVRDVRAAALEAGISAEFVELAMAESAGVQGSGTSEVVERRARRFLGIRTSSVEVSKVVKSPAVAVHEAMQRVLPSARYALLLVDTLGEDPVKDGVFVFEPPSMWSQTGVASSFAQRMGSIRAKRLYVSLREVSPDRTEVSIRAPFDRGNVLNYRVGLGTTGALGIASGVGGAAAVGTVSAMAAMAAPVAIALGAAAAVAGAAAGGGGSWWLWRVSMGYYVRKAEEALETLLQVVDASARGGFPMPGPTDPSGSGLGF